MALLSKFTTKTVTIVQIGDDSALTMMNHVMGAFIPIINNQEITEYIDKNNKKQTVPTFYTKQGAINQAYQIAKLCPNFNKTR